MLLQLHVDLDKISGDTVAELARILRYWAANLKHYPLEEGSGEAIWTSTTEVG